jgi:hypothetical protein
MPHHGKHARATTSLSSIDPPLHLVPSSSPWSVHLWFSSSTLRRAVEADLHSPCRRSCELQISSSEESSRQGHNRPNCLGILYLRLTCQSPTGAGAPATQLLALLVPLCRYAANAVSFSRALTEAWTAAPLGKGASLERQCSHNSHMDGVPTRWLPRSSQICGVPLTRERDWRWEMGITWGQLYQREPYLFWRENFLQFFLAFDKTHCPLMSLPSTIGIL